MFKDMVMFFPSIPTNKIVIGLGGYILACESSNPVICQQSHDQELG